MGSPLPEDPYMVLGVAKDTPSAQIKSTYRKLALKCHPDKVSDESQKANAADQFHRIQTAYEIIGDEDRRARYDAQVKLAELRRDVLQKQGGVARSVEVRAASYEMPSATPNGRAAFAARGPETLYEERRPAFDTDYFDAPRAGARKDREYERAARPTPTRGGTSVRGEKVHVAKENERASRNEKTRRKETEVRRERDYKRSPYVEDETDSSSDDSYAVYERAARRKYDERASEERARQAYLEQERKQKEAAAQGHYDPRSAKTLAQDITARDYIERSERTGRRPSPKRVSSSVRGIEVLKGSERPSATRRGSDRSRVVVEESHSARRGPRRDTERRASVEDVDEPKTQRPPTLQSSRSAPGQIHLPSGRAEPVRATSLQAEPARPEDGAPPAFSRSSTMPNVSSRTRKDTTVPVRSSGLRQTEINEGLPTPGTTPTDYTGSTRHNYSKEYADDYEYPTPDGYRTEVREPVEPRRKFYRSPSPVRREKPTRTSSSRYQHSAPPPPERTTSYYATPEGVQPLPPSTYPPQDASRREHSSRGGKGAPLYGEIPTTKVQYNYPPTSKPAKYSPDPDDVRYQQYQSPKMASGYRTSSRRDDRSGSTRPNVDRSDSNGVFAR